MANPTYVRETLYRAVIGMACDPRSLKDRLHGASVSFHTLTADDFIPALKAHFEKIDSLRAKADSITGHGPDETLKAAIDSMSDEEVREVIKAVVSLYDQLTRWQ